MRLCLVFVLLALASNARAQKQERSLVDRLLKPDTSLTNTDFSRSFDAGKSARTASASTRAFYVSESKLARNFTSQRSFITHPAPTKSLPAKAATLATAYAANGYATRSSSQPMRPYPVSTTATQSYAGNRAFTVTGKSQKALDRRNPPMTIEQVRELLNKNK